jgi:hypothetical protein
MSQKGTQNLNFCITKAVNYTHKVVKYQNHINISVINLNIAKKLTNFENINWQVQQLIDNLKKLISVKYLFIFSICCQQGLRNSNG